MDRKNFPEAPEARKAHETQQTHKKIDAGRVIEAFRERFGAEAGPESQKIPEFIVRAPGRVNLIGEHTDYNGGFVLPMTIDRAVWMGVRGRSDGEMRVYAAAYGGECRCGLREDVQIARSAQGVTAKTKNQEHWFEYIKGCAWALQQEKFPLTGFDAVLIGDVPQGAGLSSSAALEVCAILAFAELGGYSLTGLQTAKMGQRAENEWIGMKCGIMDQLICALGQADKALLLDCRSLEHELFALPEGTCAAVLDTATRHAFHNVADSPYNERREQCEAACEILGVSLLRDATQEMLDAHKSRMPLPVYRRARHVISENLRVLAAAEALKQGNADRFARLMNGSHFSLQHDYQVSCPELDAISDIARSHPACLGARMTGGGFGGSAVALVYAEMGDFIEYVTERYAEQTGKTAAITVCRATDGGKAERLLPREI